MQTFGKIGTRYHFKKKELSIVDSKSNVNRFVLRYTQYVLFFYLCLCSVDLIFLSFSDVLSSCLWSLSWSDFYFPSLSLSRPGEIRIQFHSLISGFGIRSQSGSYNRASLCFYWWSGEHWTLKSMFRHWFSISLSLSWFLQGMSPNPLLTHHPSSIPQKDKKVHIFNNAFRVHIGYALRMSNCRFWMVTPKYGRGTPCQCRGFHTYSLWSSSLKAMMGRVGTNKCRALAKTIFEYVYVFAYKNSHTWGLPDTMCGRTVCWEKYELESGRAARGKILHLWITPQW